MKEKKVKKFITKLKKNFDGLVKELEKRLEYFLIVYLLFVASTYRQ